MIQIRAEYREEYTVISRVNNRAFKQEDEARLVERIRALPDFIPALSLVAEYDGTIVGHIVFSPILIQTSNGPTSALLLAPMAVLPEYQRQGIGSLLVRKGLERCRSLGHSIVVVIGHPEYYPRFGFVPARSKGLDVSFSVPDEAFMVCELIPGALDGVSGQVHLSSAFDGMM